MKIRTLAFGLAAGILAGSVSVALAQDAAQPRRGDPAALVAQQGDADGAFVMPGRFSEPDGEKLYRRVCAACHMPDAAGATGAGKYPALANNPNLAASGYPMLVTLKGLNGMPPVGEMMTDQQVANVVNYVRTHFGNHYEDAITAEDVKAMR
ncbi:c-type cytochrome [Sphingobium sp. B12D2B]|uniref:c-type cytochrome n=1 Tax=Sphingobium sp. B12D2B TaxID=2940577 RepID=UPI002225A2C9|nr:cytochrome c [Sphingobium sp. B12D2B]MCW2350189.1 mono/diheme cytochrome c family protein [Sphingobium sp. B12D2B]